VDGVVLVGRVPGDPPAGTRIPYSQGIPPGPVPTDPPDDPDPTDPPAELEAKFTIAIDGSTVAFDNNTAAQGASWAWDFGDGATSDQKNPSHEYAGPGRYSVTLTVTTADGTDSVTRRVRIEEPEPPPEG
jgi:PKD repeat protein